MYNGFRDGTAKGTVEQIGRERMEELIVRCHDPGAAWVGNITFWLRRYVLVYGIIMLCTFFMCLLFSPGSELAVVPFFGSIMVFMLDAILPLVHRRSFWHSMPDILIYAGFILLAKVLWHLADYGLNAKTAAQINERIRKTRLEKRCQRLN